MSYCSPMWFNLVITTSSILMAFLLLMNYHLIGFFCPEHKIKNFLRVKRWLSNTIKFHSPDVSMWLISLHQPGRKSKQFFPHRCLHDVGAGRLTMPELIPRGTKAKKPDSGKRSQMPNNSVGKPNTPWFDNLCKWDHHHLKQLWIRPYAREERTHTLIFHDVYLSQDRGHRDTKLTNKRI